MNNTNDILTLPPCQSSFLWKTSWISFFSVIYAIKQKHYDLVFVPGGVLIFSLNYWRYPVKNSYRRYLDISYGLIAFLYQAYRAKDSQYQNIYYVFAGSAFPCYFISRYIRNKVWNISFQGIWLSTLFHSFIHLFGNIANIILYSGEMKKFKNIVFY